MANSYNNRYPLHTKDAGAFFIRISISILRLTCSQFCDVYLRPVKPKYLFLILFSGLLSCDSVIDTAAVPAPKSMGDLSRRLAGRQGIPVEAAALESWMIAEVPPGYEIQEIKASSVIIGGIPITEGRLVCTNQNGYLTLLLTDYIQDSLSYLQLYRRYLDEAPAEAPASLEWVGQYGGFGWLWSEPGTDIQYLEAGILDRFHLRIRSNQPSAGSLLRKIGREKNWKSIFASPPLN